MRNRKSPPRIIRRSACSPAASAKAYEPQTSIAGEWLVCSPETVPGFSAVGYLFARDLQKELNVPVGILTLSFGASTAEAWISREVMAADPQMKPMLDAARRVGQVLPHQFPRRLRIKAPPHPQDHQFPSRRAGPEPQRDPVQDQHNPTVLFNGMINPVIPYAIRGVIWYQGESIVGGTPGVNLYGHVQQALITGLAQALGRGRFPILHRAAPRPEKRQQQSAHPRGASHRPLAAAHRHGGHH